MLKLYDYLDEITSIWHIEPQSSELKYYASDVMQKIGAGNEQIDSAVQRTLSAFRSMNIPVKNNMKQVFRYHDGNIESDWKLSSLACYLLVINSDPGNPNIAQAQLFFALKN